MSPFEKRQYSGKQIIKAGDMLRQVDELTPSEREWALDVLDNFRALHAMPLNAFQATLRKRIEKALKKNKQITLIIQDYD